MTLFNARDVPNVYLDQVFFIYDNVDYTCSHLLGFRYDGAQREMILFREFI